MWPNVDFPLTPTPFSCPRSYWMTLWLFMRGGKPRPSWGCEVLVLFQQWGQSQSQIAILFVDTYYFSRYFMLEKYSWNYWIALVHAEIWRVFAPVPETGRKLRARKTGPPKKIVKLQWLHCALTYYFWLRQARAIFVNDTPSLVHDILFLILVLSTVWYWALTEIFSLLLFPKKIETITLLLLLFSSKYANLVLQESGP